MAWGVHSNGKAFLPGVDTISGNWEFDQKNLGIWEFKGKNLGIWELIIFGNWEFKHENLGIWE